MTALCAAALCLCTEAHAQLQFGDQPEPDTHSAAAEEPWQARVQLTYTQQRHAAFGVRRPVTANASTQPIYSLTEGADKSYTGSLTGFFGYRPWKGGEVYFNPELTVGVPFTRNLIGLGTFYNGEITRAAGSTPKLWRQRLFYRHTWNAGGGSEPIERDFNWLGGQVDKNRWVLTMGNFATLDIFDKNAYAGDPRRQFSNWANMANAAYDYAADARGFGWGASLEWYHGDWAVRFARMTGPKQPNDLPVDFNLLKHYGDQLEIEHNHQINGLDGAARLLMWRNRAVLARFTDATAAGQADGWAGSGPNGTEYILNVRNAARVKYGIGINLEQAVTADAGVFLRAMWADGQTETHAFAEVDRSFATGVALKGSRWSRAQDTLGLAYMLNGLSAQRREYLAKGGTSFFIGDGWLNYRPEQVVEVYYNAHISNHWWITANAQHIRNPAYNADRGPVTVWGLRVHAEF